MYIDDSLEVVGFLAGTLDFVGFLFIFPPLESLAAFEYDLTEKVKLLLRNTKTNLETDIFFHINHLWFQKSKIHSPSKCLVRFGLYGVKWP